MAALVYYRLRQKGNPLCAHERGLGILYLKLGPNLDFGPKWMDKVLPELVQLLYVSGLWAFGAVFDGKLHPLPLFQVPESLPADSRVMHKDILRASIGLDKPVPFDAAEPFDCAYGSLRHAVRTSFFETC